MLGDFYAIPLWLQTCKCCTLT